MSNDKQCSETRLLSNCREISANKFEIPFFMGLQFWIINSDQFGSCSSPYKLYHTFEDHLNVSYWIQYYQQHIPIEDHMLPMKELLKGRILGSMIPDIYKENSGHLWWTPKTFCDFQNRLKKSLICLCKWTVWTMLLTNYNL